MRQIGIEVKSVFGNQLRMRDNVRKRMERLAARQLASVVGRLRHPERQNQHEPAGKLKQETDRRTTGRTIVPAPLQPFIDTPFVKCMTTSHDTDVIVIRVVIEAYQALN